MEFTRRDMYQFILSHKWTYATTYAKFAPHEYLVREKCPDKEAFDLAGKFIQDNGMRMFYYKNERKYLFCDGYFYWILRAEDNPADAVINRCKPDDYDIVFMKRGTQARKVDNGRQMSFDEI